MGSNPPQGNMGASVQTIEIDDNAVTNAKIATHVSTKITGLPTQTQPLAMGSFKITGLANGTVSADAVNLGQLNALVQGLDVKSSVRVASTADLTLSGEQTIDGVLTSADRILVKEQTLGENNGIYVTDAGAWTRSTDADVSADVTAGLFTFVEEGTVNGDNGYILITNDPIVLGTTPLVFTQFTGLGQVTAGAGLTKTLNTIDVIGTTNRILVNADDVDISPNYVGQTSITTLGTIGTGTWEGGVISDTFLSDTWNANKDAAGFTLQNVKFKNGTPPDFEDETLRIFNPAGTFRFKIIASAIAGDRRITLPLLTGNDSFVFENHIQTLAGKTLTTPTIASFTNATHTHLNAAGGGTITEAAISDLGTLVALKADNLSVFAATTSSQLAGVISDETGSGLLVFGTSPTIVTPTIASFTNATHDHEDAAGGGVLVAAALPSTIVYNDQANTYSGAGTQNFGNADLILGTGKLQFQTNMFISKDTDDMALDVEAGAAILFREGTTARFTMDSAGISLQDNNISRVKLLEINNPADTFQYIFTGSAILADRVLTLPLLTGADTVVTEAHIQNITKKTFPGTDPNQFEDNGLQIQNPANTFVYTIQSSAIGASRTATIPLLTGNDSFVFEAHIQNISNKIFLGTNPNQFEDDALQIQNPANTFVYTIKASALITSSKDLTLPLITANDTFAVLGLGQTFTGANIFDLGVVINEGGTDSDTRIEGNGQTNLFFTDASTDRIGMGTNVPDNALHLLRASNVDLKIESTGVDTLAGIRLQNDVQEYRIMVDGANSDILSIVDVTDSGAQRFSIDTSGNVKINSGFLELTEIASPSNPAANDAKFFAKDVGGITKPFWRDSAGTESDLTISPIGKHDIGFSATSFIERATNPPATSGLQTRELPTNDINISYWEFTNAGGVQAIQGQQFLPRNFDNATITAFAYWTAPSGTGNVAWKIKLLFRSNDDPLDAALGAETEIVDTLIAANDLMVSSSGALTVTGSADNDMVIVQVERDPADAQDTFTGDAQLLGVKLVITTDAATAA